MPLIAIGTAIKKRYFRGKGLGEAYEEGLDRGKYLIERAKYEDQMRKAESPEKGTIWEEAGIEFDEAGSGDDIPIIHPLYLGGKVDFSILNFFNYFAIQFELWRGIGRRLGN